MIWPPFRTLNQVARHARTDLGFGYRSGPRPLIGHDQGSPLAAWCALARPDVFDR